MLLVAELKSALNKRSLSACEYELDRVKKGVGETRSLTLGWLFMKLVFRAMLG